MSAHPANGLYGQTVIITGGSRGLGACVASVLGDEGMRIVIADLATDRAAQCASTLVERGIEAVALPLDVGDEVQVQGAIARVCERFGRLDVVVNNAAIDITVPIDQLSGADWERVVRTNLSGPFFMSKHAVAAMGAKGGHI